MTIREKITQGRTYLGIELGSTRIKACLIDDGFSPIADGAFSWENRFEDGWWTYHLDEIHTGIQSCFADLSKHVMEHYGVKLEKIGAMGISAMMHGYMAFDENDALLTPFRTWRNTGTQEAAEELTALLGFNIPQRWTISHLYQAILKGEEHLQRLSYVTTLAGYIHRRLTGQHEVGIGEASGIFPVADGGYHPAYLKLTEERFAEKGFCKSLTDILPAVRTAGASGAVLTAEGAAFLDLTGTLKAGIPVCPPEGDAGTGMTATNSIRPRTGNISAGTSIFSMLVLEQPMNRHYPEIDMVTTPDGAPVAMVHCNNCCGELDAWVRVFGEFAALSGNSVETSALYRMLYDHAMRTPIGDSGIVAYNYLSAEPVAGVTEGCPLYFRRNDSTLTLGGFFRAQLYAAAAALRMGMDILFMQEHVQADGFTGHGGLFKAGRAPQQMLADALQTKIMTMQTAGEGGAWGMALLAAYMECGKGRTLAEFLEEDVFGGLDISVCTPDADGAADFESFMNGYRDGIMTKQGGTQNA